MSRWFDRPSYDWFKSWAKVRQFSKTSWDREAKVIRRKASDNNAGVVGNVTKSYKNKDAGIFKLQNTFDAGFEPLASGGAAADTLSFVGYYTTSTVSGGTATFPYSSFTMVESGDSVQSGDLIIAVFGRGNSSGYYDTYSTYPPSETNGNFTWIPNAADGGDDSRDHDHAIFQRTVGSETTTTFNPDGYGSDSAQACAWHLFVFRNATGVDSGQGFNRSNWSTFDTTGVGDTAVNPGEFVIFSHANAYFFSSSSTTVSQTANVSVVDQTYESVPGRRTIMVNDTDDINMQAWLAKIARAGTWESPTFSAISESSSSDATMVMVRVY